MIAPRLYAPYRLAPRRSQVRNASAGRIMIPNAAGRSVRTSLHVALGSAGSGRALGSVPTTSTPWPARPRPEAPIADTSTITVPGRRGATFWSATSQLGDKIGDPSQSQQAADG